MVRTSVLRFTRPEIDLACGDKRFSSEFFLDLGFQTLAIDNPVDEDKWWIGAPKGDGSICFFDQGKLLETKTIAVVANGHVEKGGWLTKRGHKVKNMKRRWFVLKDPTLCYYKNPRDTTPAGVIILDDILTVVSEKNIYQDTSSKGSEKLSFWFEIITKKTNYLICADSETDMRDWVEAIEFALQMQKNQGIHYQLKQQQLQYQTQPPLQPPDSRRGLKLSDPFLVNPYLVNNDSKNDIPKTVDEDEDDVMLSKDLASISNDVEQIQANINRKVDEDFEMLDSGGKVESVSEKKDEDLFGSHGGFVILDAEDSKH